MEVMKLVLVWGGFALLVMTVLGIRRARRARAPQLLVWSPVLLYLAGLVIAVLWGALTVSLGLTPGWGTYISWTLTFVATCVGTGLFFKFPPTTTQT
jgi:hypothetical protein